MTSLQPDLPDLATFSDRLCGFRITLLCDTVELTHNSSCFLLLWLLRQCEIREPVGDSAVTLDEAFWWTSEKCDAVTWCANFASNVRRYVKLFVRCLFGSNGNCALVSCQCSGKSTELRFAQ